MANIGRIIAFDIDLSLPLKQVHASPMIEGDRMADVIEITLNNRGETVDLTGLTAVANAEMSGQDGVTVRNPGTVGDGKITIPLQAECYAVPGSIRITVTLTAENETRTVLVLTGYVEQNGTGIIIDPTGSIPNYDDLARIVAELEAAKQAANTAASNANNKASAANTAAQTANTAAHTANTAASNADNKASAATTAAQAANTAAATANAAAAKIDDLTVSATGLAAGASPTAAVSDADGHKHIAFGIPQGAQGVKGDTGQTPNLTIGTVTTGAPGSSASAALTGTPENPVLSLTIPQGNPGTGNGTVTAVNGVEPDAAGYVALSAADVGALATDSVAADAAMLGGKAPAYYTRPRNLLDNSDFRNPVNQRGITTLNAANGNLYTIDRWRLDKGKTITVNNGSITLDGGWLTQVFEDGHIDETKIYTMAVCLVDGSVQLLSGKFVDEPRSAHLGMGKGSSVHCYCGIRAAGEYIWAALYEGAYTADTLPPYVPKGYAAELAECQRYFYRNLLENRTISGYYTASAKNFVIPWPCRMRTTDINQINVALRGNGVFRGCKGYATTNDGSGDDLAGCTIIKEDYGIRIVSSVAFSEDNNTPGALVFAKDAYIDLDCDL